MRIESTTYSPVAELLKKLQPPMLLICFVWLSILISTVAFGVTSALFSIGTGIWILLIHSFSIPLATVANRIAFLKRNLLCLQGLLVSVLRFYSALLLRPNIDVALISGASLKSDQFLDLVQVAIEKRKRG